MQRPGKTCPANRSFLRRMSKNNNLFHYPQSGVRLFAPTAPYAKKGIPANFCKTLKTNKIRFFDEVL